MGMIQVQLAKPLQQVADRQVAQGRVASQDEFLIEAARRFAKDIASEDEVVAEAEAGAVDWEMQKASAPDIGRWRTSSRMKLSRRS